jgi:beta-glucanase (GH16 family)
MDKSLSLTVCALLVLFSFCNHSSPDKKYQLVWQDEFDGTQIDASSWGFDTGGEGWGNNELEYYTDRPENASVSGGNLVITARKEDYNGRAYTSARMITKGKRSFLYGRADIRAKLPKGQGIWPALWMLGQNIDEVGWPKCGEIDIMELLGHAPDTVYGTVHWGVSENELHSKGDRFVLQTGNFSDDFHVFSVLWEEDSLQILVDDYPYLTITKQEFAANEYPFDKPQYFLFNIAVGGDWPGSPDASTVFPQQMLVDYIRVFQKKIGS